MIFNITQGGVAYISVTSPSGASISASCSGVTVTGTGTCVLEVPIIGTWTVTSVYDGVTKNQNVSVASFGETYSVTFTYTATLTVTTFPGASVAISKTGHSETKTATGGTATFTIPAGKLGTYSITSTYSSWNGSASVNVNAYDTNFPATINLSVCDFKFVAGGLTYTFTKDSTTNDYAYCYFYHSGANWEFYAKVSGTLQFTARTVIDVFLCGGGNNGASNLNNTSSGGNGGARKTVSNQTLSGNVTVTVGSAGNNSSLGSLSSSGGSVSSGGGQNVWTFYAGADGGYCFNDSSAKGPDGNSRKVGAGGGHGAYSDTDGTSQGTRHLSATNGGSYGGGAGGDSKIDGSSWWANDGSNGTFYGAGGGGAGVYSHDTKPERRGKGNGGAGHSGVAGMRNKR